MSGTMLSGMRSFEREMAGGYGDREEDMSDSDAVGKEALYGSEGGRKLTCF